MSQDGGGGHQCVCARGYQGDGYACEEARSCQSLPCLHGGTCSEGTFDAYSCTNAAGYSGVNGAVDVVECASNPCQNGGACSDSTNEKTVIHHSQFYDSGVKTPCHTLVPWHISGIYSPLPVSRVLGKEQRKTGCSR